MRITGPVQTVRLDFIMSLTFGEDERLLTASLLHFPHHIFISFPLCTNKPPLLSTRCQTPFFYTMRIKVCSTLQIYTKSLSK
jgi:hypothetical protein